MKKRAADAAVARNGSGEGSRTALARMLEQEKSRGRTRPAPDDESPQAPLSESGE